VNEAVHKETTAYGAITSAVIDTLNGAGMIGLKPTLAFKVEWEKLVTYFATWKRWPTWAERAPKTLREGVKQFYEKAMREITTKDFRRGTNIPKCGMRPILFTEQDIRLHAYYEDCGDLKIFMDLVAVGVQRFLDRYLRQDDSRYNRYKPNCWSQASQRWNRTPMAMATTTTYLQFPRWKNRILN
jgi:hypothetical protein